MWSKFLTSNSSEMRLFRTIVQGIIGVLIANMDAIVEAWNFSPTTKTIIVGFVMAVLSPVMAEIGKTTVIVAEVDDEMDYLDYEEGDEDEQ